MNISRAVVQISENSTSKDVLESSTSGRTLSAFGLSAIQIPIYLSAGYKYCTPEENIHVLVCT